jgi:transposase
VTVPEVRRLLRLLASPAEQRAFLLHWSRWRRTHQAGARRGHVARRARATPTRYRPPAAEPLPAPAARPPWTDLSDAGWARVRPLLPPKAPVGRPPCDGRLVLAGVLWVLRTDAGWRALPSEFGPWRTIYGRYRQWRLAGLWPRLVQALQDTAALEVSL